MSRPRPTATRGGPAAPEELAVAWTGAWPTALAAWSRFTKLRPPTLCMDNRSAAREGLTSSFAMIRLIDQSVVVNLASVAALGLDGYATEILAHEIGHHVLAPATMTDHARTIARMRRALPTVEIHAPMVANLYTDLLVNNRLQRDAALRIAEVYRRLKTPREDAGAVWALYLRMYERLWSLPRGDLGGGATDDRIEGDAWLGARLIRSYARDWLDGAGRFAALLLPHLLRDEPSRPILERWFDTRDAASGGDPAGLTGEAENERTGAIHPSEDPDLAGDEGDAEDGKEGGADSVSPRDADATRPAGGQHRQPFEYGEILRAAGVALDDHEAAIRYYRERALPHLVPFPSRPSPSGSDPLPEGLEPWDIGHPLDDLDGLQSVLQSPRVIPGVTTVRRLWGVEEGQRPQREPLDLDLYVDSSGSMANPQRLVSYPALAGAILCLSALRAGARVQATLWSGTHEFISTRGFVRDETAILRVLTGYFGGATAFPIHALRDTYDRRFPAERPAHILVISDDGVSTMFDRDERGNSGWDVATAALETAGGGGTMVLNLPAGWDGGTGSRSTPLNAICLARDRMGWNVHRVTSWDELIDFARAFSQRHYSVPPS